ncbi:hypothetical protein HMN09_00386000 [Mycena chlorophos]|uniref:F-box domain-containing protein n=1 Tax=Mycena chlorophos TaxID=658473 RepID=A0A8H6WID1_MYCCL|nr:hypothetical protein HMN09_00386000 [Mycena chlorophos]
MPFSALDEDIIPQILAFCDVRTVLRFGQTNKLSRALSQKRSVWRALLQDLADRCVLDAVPGHILRDAKAEYMYKEVKRAICGPETWLPNSSSLPSPYRVLEVKAPEFTGPLKSVRVLPGGKYLLVQRDAFLETGFLEGTSRCGMAEKNCWCSCAYRGTMWLWELRKINLETQTEQLVFSEAFSLQLRPLWLPVVSGYFVTAAIQPIQAQNTVILVDWRVNMYTAFKIETFIVAIHLTADHLIILHSLHLHVAVYDPHALRSSSSRWFPLHELTPQKIRHVHGILPIFNRPLYAYGRPINAPDEVTLSLRPSPLVRGGQIGKLYISQIEELPRRSSLVAKLVRKHVLHRPPPTEMRDRAYVFDLVLSPCNDSPSGWKMHVSRAMPAVPGLSSVVLSLAGYLTLERRASGPGGGSSRDIVIRDVLLLRHQAPTPRSAFQASRRLGYRGCWTGEQCGCVAFAADGQVEGRLLPLAAASAVPADGLFRGLPLRKLVPSGRRRDGRGEAASVVKRLKHCLSCPKRPTSGC